MNKKYYIVTNIRPLDTTDGWCFFISKKCTYSYIITRDLQVLQQVGQMIRTVPTAISMAISFSVFSWKRLSNKFLCVKHQALLFCRQVCK
jgi:hypothetical protein